MNLAEFQKHIAERYLAADSARGWAKTFAYLIEEVGELATALANEDKSPGGDRANLEEEFADVLAWLCTLANVANVDLPAAIQKKYFSDDAPTGTK